MFSFQGASEFPKKLNEESIPWYFSQFLMVESTGIEPVTSCLQGRRSPSWANPPYRPNKLRMFRIEPRLNVQILRCLSSQIQTRFVGLWICKVTGMLWRTFEFILPPSSFPEEKWWAKMDSNHRPHDYQSCALASWAIGPYSASTSYQVQVYLYPLNWIT